MRIILFIVFYILLCFGVQARHNNPSRFNYLVSPNYERRSNAITSIVQDDIGLIWMGSRKGLFQFNGNEYKEVKHVNQYLEANFKNDIAVLRFDTKNWLWIGTQHGLVVYDTKSAQIISLPDLIAKDKNIVNGITSIKNGDVIIAGQHHLYAYIASENTYKDITPSIQGINQIKRLHFYAACQIGNSLWVSTSFGLCQLKTSAGKYELSEFYTFKKLYSENIINHKNIELIEDGNGDLIVCTYNKMFKFNLKDRQLHPYWGEDNTYANKITRTLALDKKNRLWIGTMSGILIDDPHGVISISYNPEQSNSLSDDRIKSLFVDRNNTIWIGTYFGGVNYWNDRNIKFFHINDKTPNGLTDKTINCIAEDANGIIYFGTEKSGISTYNSLNGKYGKPIKYGASPATFIYPDSDNKIWIGTISDGLICHHSETGKQQVYFPDFNSTPKFTNNRISSMVKENDTLFWVGVKFEGLHQFSPKTGKFIRVVPTDKNIQLKTVSHCNIDSLGNLWCATLGHLYILNKKFRKQNKYHFSEIKTEKGNKLYVYDIYIDKKNTVWVAGANNVLYKYSSTGFSKIDIGENVTIFSIVAGKDGVLWLSSSIGVLELDVATSEFKVFDSRHGLHMNAFCDAAGLSSMNGNIYFGGTSGATYFNPSIAVNDVIDTGEIIITDLLVYNKPVVVGDNTGILSQSIEHTNELTLHYTQNMFAIKFSYDDFGYTARYNFEYRLKGLNNEWMQTTDPMVAYTLQSGGEYVFEVRYLTPEGIPASKVKQLHIRLQNPFWKTGWAYATYVFILFLILGAVFYLYRSRIKVDFQLQMELANSAHRRQVHEHKLNFFTNISHDFRTPLTLIIGAIDQMVTKYSLNHEMYRMLTSVQKNTNLLLSLINDLMDFRKIESKQMVLQVAENNIVDFVREIFLSFKIQADIRKLNLTFTSSDSEIALYFDTAKMERVIYNLLSNAFKFTEKGGEINVTISQNSTAVTIAVKDTGCGIAPENFQYVFERFYEKNNQNNSFSRGTGIGLSISKSIVELHKGTIVFDSLVDEGTTFTITLLKGKVHFNEKELSQKEKNKHEVKQVLWDEDQDQKRKIASIVEDTWRKKEKTYSILIAEDNEELGLYLKGALGEYFNVTLEANGKTAFKSALNDLPDLIISDVMMPVMDGIEFCKKIKTTIETSYIPFVMLTARTSLIYKYEGLESGADEYLSKPFQFKELLLKCINILNTQDNLRQKFLQQNELTVPDDGKETNVDKELYYKTMQILNKNVANEIFTVQDLCIEMGLSRSVLYTKVKDWTDQSPGELLLGFRMKKAAQLLERQQYTIAQIASKVGYKRANYFSKSFKNYHKLSPSDYIKKFC